MKKALIVFLITIALLSTCYANFAVLNAFNSGELSPLLEGRSDIKKYYSGCRTLENMVVLPHGGVTKRPGTYYVASAKSSAAASRLVAFEYSVIQAYILEFGHEYIRFYKDGGQILSGVTPYEVTTTYDGNDIFELQFVQSADTMYIAHPDYAPRSLTRSAHTTWTLTTIDFERGPFLDENDTDITITPPASSTDVTSGETFTASGEYSASYTVEEAFDDIVIGINGWAAGSTDVTDQWVKVKYAAGKTVVRIRIQPCQRIGWSAGNIQHCKLQGSNAAAPNAGEDHSDWTKIPAVRWMGRCSAYDTNEITVEQINNYTDWADIEFTNTTSYTHYRLWFYDNYGSADYLWLKEIEMFESSGTTYTASDDIFTEEHVGSIWQITHTDASSATTGTLDTTDTNSDTTSVQLNRKYDFTTEGTWSGTISLQNSYDGGTTWKDVYTHVKIATDDWNLSYSDSEVSNDALYRVYMSGTVSGTCTYDLTIRSFDIDGIIKITAWTSATKVIANVIETLNDTAPTTYWSEGAWSDDEGYPSCVAFYEERQVYAASTNQSQTIWMSQTGDWDNFAAGADDTDAITITIAADQVNAIRWLSPQTALLIGTTGGEWRVSATEETEPITPTNISAKRQSSYGSANLQAIGVNNLILYVQRQGQKIRKLHYSWELDNWIAPDLTLLSEHITGDGVSQLAMQKNPYPILWCVRDDGALIGVTLEESNEVIGWHRHEFSGDVESAAVIPGDSEDEVWISIERTIDDSPVRYIEQMQSFDWGDDQADCFYVDSGLTYDGGAAVTITDITQANPAVVTSAAHGLEDGDQIRFADVLGMTYVNNRVYTVQSVDVNSFSLRDSLNEVDVDSGGTIAHWTMDDNTNTTTVEDTYGHDGTLVWNDTENITVGGKIGSALSFSSGAYGNLIVVDDDNDFSFGDGSDDSSFSVSFWMKAIDSVASIVPIKKYTAAGVDSEWWLFIVDGKLQFHVYDNSATSYVGRRSSTFVLSTDTWYHIVVTYDGTAATTGVAIYVDTTQRDDQAVSSGSYTAMENLDADVHIGFTGKLYLDDLRILNKELTSLEIETLYNHGLGTATSLKYSQYISGGQAQKVEKDIVGLGHLVGETVAVLQDGGDAGTQTVSDSSITLDDFYNTVHAGLPITAKLQPMKLEMATSPGSLFGIPKRITEITIRFYRTSGCDVGPSWTDYDSYLFRDASDLLDTATPLYSGDKTIAFDGDYELAGNIFIQSQLPLPLTISALMAEYEVAE